MLFGWSLLVDLGDVIDNDTRFTKDEGVYEVVVHGWDVEGTNSQKQHLALRVRTFVQ